MCFRVSTLAQFFFSDLSQCPLFSHGERHFTDLGERINRGENKQVIALVMYERKARGNLAFADNKKFKDV